MASTLPISQSQAFSSTAGVALPKPFVSLPPRNPTFQSWAPLHRRRRGSDSECRPHRGLFLRFRTPFVVFAARTAEMPKKDRSSAKGFVEEMRAVAMKLHTRDQAKEGEKEPDSPPVAKWEPSLQGYLRFLVDSKLVYDTLETIVRKASHPWYAEFRNTGLERSEKLAKDLEWFKEQGHVIPEPSSSGISYACYLEELSEKDPQAFICHFYNVYFAHTAGGRIIGKKVAEKILNKKELEFYKWDGDLSQLLQNVRDKLNQVASSWSREEKNHCLEETEKSFKFSGEILRLIVS